MNQEYLNIELATPNGKRSIGQALSCSAPGVLGKFQILPNHTAFVSQLDVGSVKIEMPDKVQLFAVSGGYLEVVDNQLLLLLDSAEAAEEIDVERAGQAKDRADERLSRKSDKTVDTVRAEAALSRAVNRLKVAQRASTVQ